jgi:dUTP pyrophosphatase
MEHNEVLQLYIRSSLAIKYGMQIDNQVGIIDFDYFNNADNEGHIIIALRNDGNKMFYGKKFDRIAQGIFMNYLITDDDVPVSDTRVGGIGSTTAK